MTQPGTDTDTDTDTDTEPQSETAQQHGHGRGHQHAHDSEHEADTTDEQFWDDRYASSQRVWSGNPNTALARELADLIPGSALDLGCGEGGDAIWLAGQGWRVTAVDISQVALDRAAAHAAEAGVGERIDWQRHDLGVSFPAGAFDLVSAQFLYFRGEASREQTLRAAAAAVAPGGVLLIESHSGFPAWENHGHAGMEFLPPEQILSSLHLPDGEWETLTCREHERIQNAPDGRPTTRTDSTVKLRRAAG
ncbi:MAG TPA: class I SAM-dependent methyltransferase [Actinocrinis sp.]|nr:class I SAM-dependent methyltransferase [Actinocrinis sp.]